MKNRTCLYGEGLFETFRVHVGQRLAFVEDHLERMAAGSVFFGFPFSRKEACKALKLGLKQISLETAARLRLNLLCYGDDGVERTDFQTSWEPLKNTVAGTDRGGGVKLGLAPFSRFSRSPLVRFKTTSYLENIYGLRWARGQGLFDALFTNERDEITEGSISNVFFIESGRIVTPPLDAGLLPGITRKQVIEIAESLDFTIEEKAVPRKNLERFGGAFVTNSVVGLLPVRQVDDRAYGSLEIVKGLQHGYEEREKSSTVSPDAL
jgi:branched-subunit amino acid aminotransferase/4-amino-4-deoxychorismate lyase